MSRGGADELSDLDTRIWVADDDFDSMLADLPPFARAVGVPLDILFETPGSHFCSCSTSTAFSLNSSPSARPKQPVPSAASWF